MKKEKTKNRNIFFLRPRSVVSLFLILFLGVFVAGNFSFAANPVVAAVGSAINDTIATALSTVVGTLVNLVGGLLTIIMSLLIKVAKYNNFINAGAVTTGWVIVRDICNMFFILILLVIAFATILRVEGYDIKKMVPKLIIMAVLINFSKTICGLILDAANIIMNTFISAFGDTGELNMIQMMGLNDVLTFAKNNADAKPIDVWKVFGAYVFALIYVVIAIVVVVVLLAVLVVRIVMLWIYIVLSPLAYLMATFPQGQKYASRWWDDFTKYATTGPILAFFLWLSFVSLGNSQTGSDILGVVSTAASDPGGTTQAMTTDNLIKFIISIGMLMGGLIITQEAGGEMGKIAGAGMAKIQTGATWARKAGTKAITHVPAQYAKRAGYGLADKALEVGKKMPIAGGAMMKAQANLRMKRDYAEEKQTRYMKYLSDQDLDKALTSYKGPQGKGAGARIGQAVAFAGRGMESQRQNYRMAMVEKAKRGEDFTFGSKNPNANTTNKTDMMIELAKMAGVSITASGDESFRDADLAKTYKDFRKNNLGNIDNKRLGDFYQSLSADNKKKGLDVSGYSTDGQRTKGVTITQDLAAKLKTGDIMDLHHSQLSDDVLDAVWTEGGKKPLDASAGPNKRIAKLYVEGNDKQKGKINDWLASVQSRSVSPTNPTGNIINPGTRKESDPNDVRYGDIGISRYTTSQPKTGEAAAGITGLNQPEKGRLALDFAKIGLDPQAAGKYFQGAEKKEVVARLGDQLSIGGMSDQQVKSITNTLDNASHLILHNKSAESNLSERKATNAHELIHARLDKNFSDEELRSAWDGLDEPTKSDGRAKVKAVWGEDLSEDEVAREYFTEGLTGESRWGKNAAVNLNTDAKTKLNGVLGAKGFDIKTFVSGLPQVKPQREEVQSATVASVGPELRGPLEQLVDQIGNLGNGLNSLNRVADSVEDLQNVLRRNSLSLETNGKKYQEVTAKLGSLAGRNNLI